MTIHIHLKDAIFTEAKPHHFIAEASSLRWNDFPLTLKADGGGNGMPLQLDSLERRDGDLLWADYRQICGSLSLRVFND